MLIFYVELARPQQSLVEEHGAGLIPTSSFEQPGSPKYLMARSNLRAVNANASVGRKMS